VKGSPKPSCARGAEGGGGKEAVREAATAQGAVRNDGEEAACRAPVLGARAVARRRSLHAKMRVSSSTLDYSSTRNN
jgi:hypothetical protein